MPTSAITTTLATADCATVDTPVSTETKLKQLCMFMAPMTANEKILRTARYAENPAAYLSSTLGEAVFDDRKDQLSLAEETNMDIYGTGTHKQHFEQYIAQEVLGKQAGLFFLTGVQAQLAALKIHCERAGKKNAAWHVSSHLEEAEERSFEALYGLERTLLGNDPEALPTVKEIETVLGVAPAERPAVILVELPNRVLGCKTYSFSELQQISSACSEAGVAFHMDGARLWEIEPYYQATAGKSFADLAALFDSVYVSFYKGLGGVTGAMLVHDDKAFIAEAKVWQRRAGGNSFTLGYEIIDCERGYNENIGTFARKREKMITIVDQITEATAQFRTADGGKVVSFVPGKATCCQIHTVFSGFTASELEQARDKVQAKSNVRVFERLRPKESLDEKMKAERGSTQQQTEGEDAEAHDDRRHFMEWMIMSVTEQHDVSVFVDGYVALCEELLATK
ncbi:hypothetical protein LTR36_007425 [Oleoguttula mirabilis]|uniref:Aromatic amino acid beta-eliminating lyase/threonine aldolase domain-containing protein n=1 Tax=Oleoguttula mirabilis TaxID=1507867 RepID=A0AAV9J9Q1_9PEZI|nr:hypothetical protein LTR36_007425 [Oleoguttula mirabilis]